MRTRSTWVLAALWALLFAALTLLLAWSRNGSAPFLAGAIALSVTAALSYARFRHHITVRVYVLAALLLLGVGCTVAGAFAWRLHRLVTDWEQLQSERSAHVRRELDQSMALVIERGQRVASSAARIPQDTSRRAWFAGLEALQKRSKVDAIALFGEQGELLVWTGEHRGRVPDSVRVAPRPIAFIERPLYSYLYFSTPLSQRRGNAVVAILLETALPSEATPQGQATQIKALAGPNTSFLPGPGTATDWNLVVGSDTLLHARLDPLSQREWRLALLRTAQRLVILIGAVIWLMLGIGWYRDPARPRRFTTLLPLLGMTVTAFVAPLGSALGLEQLFSPGLFLFPGPAEVSLGSLLTILLVCGSLVSTTRTLWRHSPLWFALGTGLVTLLLPVLVISLVGPAPIASIDALASLWKRLQAWTPPLMQGGSVLWAGLQFSLVLLVAILISLVFLVARLPARLSLVRRQRISFALLAGGAGLAALLAVLLLFLGRTREQLTPLLLLFWVVPIGLAGMGTAAYSRGDGRSLVRWLTAGWLAGTALLPYLWIAQVHERLRTAGHELATLGIKPDPYLEYLLRQFGREAIARHDRGEDGLQLLYRSWVSSGLAREAYPARITIWSDDGKLEVLLTLGDVFSTNARQTETVPSYLSETFASVRELAHPEVFTAHNVEDVNQIAVVPLEPGRMITVEVPPRRTLARASVIAPILGTTTDPSSSLELVPKRTSASASVWTPTEEGWRSEVVAHYLEGDFHAHLQMRLPSLGVQIARGLLILTADLLVCLALWLAGRALRHEPVVPRGGWFGWLASFRARVTAALFGFFLLPTATFGWVAYRALAQEVTRAAQIVAERAVEQSVNEFNDVNGNLRVLANHAGADVLFYQQGELQAVSSPEALELGVYNAWMPPGVWLDLESGEEETGVARPRIGDQEFVSAFRRLRPSGTMAVPISLQSGETVLRQREMAHLILFAALVGALLSLALSVAVGRALAGPIGKLQRAAAAVGAGRLRVRLPEEQGGEFGKLFASFNRMVRRLQRARTSERRSARVLAWGEMARQVAHEIKNPLTPIKLAVQHLQRSYRDRRGDFERVLDQNVEQVLVEIDRLSEIARAFSRYGAPPESAGPLVPVSVSSVVQEALTLYRAGDLKLQYVDEVAPGLPRVRSRSDELKEVILNLLENARAATDPPGRIVISAQRAGDEVELCVEDSGVGIPRDLLPRIFEPHFSTRTTGTGLGLPIVRRLVESWGGSVQAESETGRGTTIRIRLVVAENAAA